MKIIVKVVLLCLFVWERCYYLMLDDLFRTKYSLFITNCRIIVFPSISPTLKFNLYLKFKEMVVNYKFIIYLYVHIILIV